MPKIRQSVCKIICIRFFHREDRAYIEKFFAVNFKKYWNYIQLPQLKLEIIENSIILMASKLL